MQRRLDALEKLKALVDAGTLSPKDATHRALQMLEATPQPVRLQEPRLVKISQELLNMAQNGSDVAGGALSTSSALHGRLSRLIQEDSRVKDQFKGSDTVQLPRTLEASKAAALRKMNKLQRLKESIDNASMPPLDAARRAMQTVHSAPDDIILDPRALQLVHDIIHRVDNQRIKDSMHQQLEALISSSAPPSSQPTGQSLDTSSPHPTPDILSDTVHFAKLYTAFDRSHHQVAFDLLAQITPAMWKRTPHANRSQLVKVSSMGIASVNDSVAAQQYLQFVLGVFRAKGLPLNWINQPTAFTAIAAASLQVHDSSTLLILYKSQIREFKRSRSYFARRNSSVLSAKPHPTHNNPHVSVQAPTSALFAAVVDTLGALHRQTALPEIIQTFPGPIAQPGLLALLRVLTLPTSAPHVVQLSASFPLQSFVECQYQAPLLRAMLKVDLVVEALDALLEMHTLGRSSMAKRIPSSVETDILVELYKLKAFDRFHSAYEELWARGYQVGVMEFRALSTVVPPAVLQSMLGRKEYRHCLHEVQRRASRQAQRTHEVDIATGLDLRAAPESMCAAMLTLHLKALAHPEDVIVFVSAVNQPVVEAALAAEGLSFVARHHHQLVVPAQSILQVASQAWNSFT
ncbi:hypothetical protein DYB32_001483 [Aphanomyces invadans]|uniref:Uncharacterized protein n=1 Tax=Aphanomyces invadans TaxID=157072 RepID=A0A3R7D5L1_9STRA|nr:hypothetical protein DYB32_001483 [Aphanomyces invadans]